MNNAGKTIAPEKRLRILWLAQVNSVVLVSAIAWFIPTLVELDAIPEAQLPLLIAALASIPLVFFLGRWLRTRPDAGSKHPSTKWPASGTDEPRRARTDIGSALVAWALCEVPVILGLVYVMLGGEPWHAVALGGVALVLLVLLRPAFGETGTVD